MKKVNKYEHEIPIAGHTQKLYFGPGPSCCGKITDGISFRFEGEGSWVMSYKDLVSIFDVAKAKREK